MPRVGADLGRHVVRDARRTAASPARSRGRGTGTARRPAAPGRRRGARSAARGSAARRAAPRGPTGLDPPPPVDREGDRVVALAGDRHRRQRHVATVADDVHEPPFGEHRRRAPGCAARTPASCRRSGTCPLRRRSGRTPAGRRRGSSTIGAPPSAVRTSSGSRPRLPRTAGSARRSAANASTSKPSARSYRDRRRLSGKTNRPSWATANRLCPSSTLRSTDVPERPAPTTNTNGGSSVRCAHQPPAA